MRLALVGWVVATSLGACSGRGSGTGGLAGETGSRGGGTALGGSGGNNGTGGAPDTGRGGSPAGGTGGAATGGTGGDGGATVACTLLAPLSRRLLPLLPPQFENATRDLLSLTATPSLDGVPPWRSSRASTFLIDAPYLLALYQTAGTLTSQVAPRAAALAACGAGETDAACATRFARSFGRQAFRRALDEVEVTDVMKVFATVCPGPSQSCGGPTDLASAITLMIKAFILAPSFLYRTELGPRNLTATATRYPDTVLTADEVATQLAFMFLGSTPDAGLLAAADSGALTTTAGMLSEINRLLALPASQMNVTAMVAAWLGIDRLADRTKNPTLLSPLAEPDRDQGAVADALRTSWDSAVTATLWSSPPGKVTDLLTSQSFFADWRLATLYGLPAGPARDAPFNQMVWPAAQDRAGILTHPAFLWSFSDVAQADIVARGNAVHRLIVCQDAVAPEPDPSTPERIAVNATGDSEATHSDARLASGALCADNCHREMDPYGRLLHAFDAIGNYRTTDEAGRAIDVAATLTAQSPLGPMTLSGPTAFANALVSSKVFAGCAMQRLFEAAVDVSVPTRNTCQIDDLRAAFDRSDGTMASLLRQIALSDFAHARAGGIE